MTARDHADASADLLRRLRTLLRDDLGAMPFHPLSRLDAKAVGPAATGIWTGFACLVVFCAIPWLLARHFQSSIHPLVMYLSLWGCAYMAFSVFAALQTTIAVRRIIEDRILPHLSVAAIEEIEKDLGFRFSTWRIHAMSIVISLLGFALSFVVLDWDVERLSGRLSWQVGLCCFGFFCIYVTAARATDTARFYGSFARSLHVDHDGLYPADPANSALVLQIGSLGRHMLLFWSGIGAAVLTMTLILPLLPPQRSGLPIFIPLVVSITTFLSIGFGTLVFLASEANIAATVATVRDSALHSTERDIAILRSGNAVLDDATRSRVKDLEDLHQRLVTTGAYRNLVSAVSSLIVPVMGVLVSLLTLIVKSRQ